MSFRTRALSVSVEAVGRRDTLVHLETLLSDLDARGNLCGLASDTGHKGLFASVADFVTSTCPRGPAIPLVPLSEPAVLPEFPYQPLL